MTILAPPWGRTPDPRAMNFTVLVEGVMDIITMHLVFPTRAKVEKKIFENLAFLYIWSRLIGAPGVVESWISISVFKLIPLTIEMFHTKNGNNWLCIFKKQSQNGRRTSHDDGRRPIAIIGHLSKTLHYYVQLSC